MGLFVDSQRIRRVIEGSKEIMGSLARYVAGEHDLEFLGKGGSNCHYRLGRLESGLWLATRSLYNFQDVEFSRNFYENYCIDAESHHDIRGKRTTQVLVGVRFTIPNDDEERRYFLIVEDFTAGGSTKFVPASSGRMSGSLDGREIFYDFDENWQVTKIYDSWQTKR